MARRRVAEKRDILPDPKFHDTLVTKFINVLMICGKKSTAEHIFYGALDLVAERSKQDPLTIFKRAMENALTKTDDSFPYVLVSSLLGTVVSLASVWAWTATTLGPVKGA